MVNTQHPDTNLLLSVIRQVRDAFRRMGLISTLMVFGYGLFGILKLWDWFRLLVGRGIGVDTPTMYGGIVDGVLGVVISGLAVALLWFGFKFPQLRPFRGLTMSWALIIMGGGCQRWISYGFDVSARELALIIFPMLGGGALAFATWLVWHYHEAKNEDNADVET